MFAAPVPNVHPELAGHVAVRCPISRHGRKSIPHLLAGSIGVSKLNAFLVASEATVVNVEEVARHWWRAGGWSSRATLAFEKWLLNIGQVPRNFSSRGKSDKHGRRSAGWENDRVAGAS
jgi:hypothetical protein